MHTHLPLFAPRLLARFCVKHFAFASLAQSRSMCQRDSFITRAHVQFYVRSRTTPLFVREPMRNMCGVEANVGNQRQTMIMDSTGFKRAVNKRMRIGPLTVTV